MTAKEKFLANVVKTGDHDIWSGSKLSSGYGRAYFMGKMQPAHRVAYLLFIGEIPEGFYVRQSCKIRLCVKPLHLVTTPAVGPFGLKFNIPTEETVRRIRARLQDPAATMLMIAKEFNTTSSHIFRIQHGTYRIGREKN